VRSVLKEEWLDQVQSVSQAFTSKTPL